jgi:hypothetical protein
MEWSTNAETLAPARVSLLVRVSRPSSREASLAIPDTKLKKG